MPERERDVWANYITSNATGASWSDAAADPSVPTYRFRIPAHPVCKRCKHDCKSTSLDAPSYYRTETDFCGDFEPLAEEKKEKEKNEWWDD